MNTAKIDLHLHLDGSLNIRWAYEKALKRGVIDKDMSFEAFYDLLFVNNIRHSVQSFKKFEIVCDVLQEYDDLFEATYDLCKRLDEMGLIYAEIRFASQQHCKKGMTQYDALKAVIDGADKAMEDFEIRVGIIDCLMHKGDSATFNANENLKSIAAGGKFYGKGLVGFDLAGYENNCDYRDYAPYFQLIRNMKIPYTLHTGEMDEGSHILDALAMKPNRLGHAINCIQDQRYIDALKEANIPIEVCVSSNVKLDRNYAGHPIRRMMEEGLPVTINTDNMIFARTDVVNEHHQLKMIGLSEEDLIRSTYTSLDAAFCDEKTKSILKDKLDKQFKEKAQID